MLNVLMFKIEIQPFRWMQLVVAAILQWIFYFIFKKITFLLFSFLKHPQTSEIISGFGRWRLKIREMSLKSKHSEENDSQTKTKYCMRLHLIFYWINPTIIRLIIIYAVVVDVDETLPFSYVHENHIKFRERNWEM